MAKIKSEKMDIHEPYSFRDTVFLDCLFCGEEYEWVQPFTACSMNWEEEFNPMIRCMMFSPIPQIRCIKCQVKLRLDQSKENNNVT